MHSRKRPHFGTSESGPRVQTVETRAGTELGREQQWRPCRTIDQTVAHTPSSGASYARTTRRAARAKKIKQQQQQQHPASSRPRFSLANINRRRRSCCSGGTFRAMEETRARVSPSDGSRALRDSEFLRRVRKRRSDSRLTMGKLGTRLRLFNSARPQP